MFRMYKSAFPVAALLIAATAQAQTQRSAGDGFWQMLGDTTLGRLVSEASRNGTAVRVAEARLDASRATHKQSAFDLAPTVTANGSVLRTRQSMAQVLGLTQPLPQQDLYDVGVDATWELDLFGRVRRTVNAQGAFASAAEHTLDDVQVSLAADVARSYFELRGAQRQLAVAARNADNQRKTVALTQDRLAAGRGSAFDVERARSALQLTLAAEPVLQTQVAAARYHVATLVGRSANDSTLGLADDCPLPHLPDSISLADVGGLVHRRPDVQAAERQRAAQAMSVSAARAEYLPRLSLAASTGYTANRFASLTRTGTSRIVAGPMVSFPLLDLGRVKQRVNVAEAERESADAQYAATVLRATEELRSATTAYQRSAERLAILEEAVASSQRAWDLAQQRFEAGLTDFLQVLDAQRTLLDAENQLAAGQTGAAEALVAVYRAMGGAWASP